MKYNPTEVGKRLKWINDNWKSFEKKKLVLPHGVELTPYVSFLSSNMEGTYTRYGIILDIFNGYRKKEISSNRRGGTIDYASQVMFRNVAPASTEPHARVLLEDSVRGEVVFSDVWVPIRELTFLSEETIGELDRLWTSVQAGIEVLKNSGAETLAELSRRRPIRKDGGQPHNVVIKG